MFTWVSKPSPATRLSTATGLGKALPDCFASAAIKSAPDQHSDLRQSPGLLSAGKRHLCQRRLDLRHQRRHQIPTSGGKPESLSPTSCSTRGLRGRSWPLSGRNPRLTSTAAADRARNPGKAGVSRPCLGTRSVRRAAGAPNPFAARPELASTHGTSDPLGPPGQARSLPRIEGSRTHVKNL